MPHDRDVSRRTFLGSVAALPFLAQLGAAAPAPATKQRIAVVGAGAFGGWIALQLRRSGADVTLLDAWGPGNSRSSSGGETRVIRAIYGADRLYVEMVKRAYELWTQLDASVEEPLYVETGALWMLRGDDAYVRSAVPILTDLGFPVESLALADARKRYPQIAFDGVHAVWLEHRAGALSARRACAVVRDAFVKAGGVYRTAQVEPGAIASESMAALRLSDGSGVEADTYVFACGPWLGRVFPDVLGTWIHPTRQEVFFFGTPAGSERYRPGHFPVWIDFGERIFYGLPDTHLRGFKVADDTRGEPVDPTTQERAPSADGLARARHLLAERFPELANAPLVESRVCQYENSPDGHLVIDRHPNAKNVWIAGGGSGHGFKLSPAVGDVVAHLILGGLASPPLFRLDPRRLGQNATQFDRKD
ncbi:MAG: FAD-dependent oxidoreductase [Acidobacteria bacterium]|nr:FAD-dependent oxidoreductase [Acidobacteriota bacterium]MBV9477724.1 FAD-dependent oxidoreductase [Acidobacteriota bacterium]